MTQRERYLTTGQMVNIATIYFIDLQIPASKYGKLEMPKVNLGPNRYYLGYMPKISLIMHRRLATMCEARHLSTQASKMKKFYNPIMGHFG